MTVGPADASWVAWLLMRAHLPEGASAFVLRQHGIDIRFSIELPPR